METAFVIRFLHILGAVIGVGGLIYAGLAVLPAMNKLSVEREAFQIALRRRARLLTWFAVGLLLVTGILRLPPELGGVGWLGHRGVYAGILHGKAILALFVFHLALSTAGASRDPERLAKTPRRVRLAALLGVVVILMGTIHHMQAFGPPATAEPPPPATNGR